MIQAPVPASVDAIAPMARLLDVHRSFGDVPILRGVDLTVERGEFVVLFGRNGAGKSTLLAILATLLAPSRGHVFVAGRSARIEAQAVRRSIGLVGHQSYLYGELSAEENLAFFAGLYGLRSHDAPIASLLELVGLTDRRRDRVRTFSRGMQQRLALARALLHDPPLLLLDEPETGLDAETLERFPSIVRHRLSDGAPRTVVMTTHRAEWGTALATRSLLLQQGRLVDASDRSATGSTTRSGGRSEPGARFRGWSSTIDPGSPAHAGPRQTRDRMRIALQLHAFLRKELLLELRTREAMLPMAVFGLLVLVIFSFAFDLGSENVPPAVAAGVIWTAILFSGMLGIGRSFAAERERDVLDGVLIAPISSATIYVAKLVTTLGLLAVMEAGLLLTSAVLFNLPLFTGAIAAATAIGTLGFSVVGTLFAAMAAGSRARDVLLPLLLLPVLVPVIIAVVQSYAEALAPLPPVDGHAWLQLALAFDLIFLVVSVAIFDHVVRDA